VHLRAQPSPEDQSEEALEAPDGGRLANGDPAGNQTFDHWPGLTQGHRVAPSLGPVCTVDEGNLALALGKSGEVDRNKFQIVPKPRLTEAVHERGPPRRQSDKLDVYFGGSVRR
jgi:hypothetical protein